MNPQDTRNLINEMRSLTVMTGRVSMVQEKCLKTWAFGLFNNLQSVQIDYDLTKGMLDNIEIFEHEGVNKVEYRLYTAKRKTLGIKSKKEKQLRYETLASWVRELFWEDLSVRIFHNDKLIFESLSGSNIEEKSDEINE